MDWQGSLFAKTAGRAVAAAIAVGSLAVLWDAGAKYSNVGWRATSVAREPSALEREVAAPGFAPWDFRLSANWAIERPPDACDGGRHEALESPSGDEEFDNSCAGGSSVKAVGDLPRPELLSWPDDWLYHRAVRF
jgi:hypothetical protein